MDKAKVKEAVGTLGMALDGLEEALGMRAEESTEGLIHADLWVDGGSRGNPGPGYGSWLVKIPGLGGTAASGRREFGRTTNNEAEYLALLGGLGAVGEFGEPSRFILAIHSDSALVVGQVQGGWRVKARNLWPLWDDAKRKLEQFGAWAMVKESRADVQAVLGH